MMKEKSRAWKKQISLLLALAVLLGCFPLLSAPAAAEETVKYLDYAADGSSLGEASVTTYNVVTTSQSEVTWSGSSKGGWYVVKGGTKENPITIPNVIVSGHVKLVLTDGCYLKLSAPSGSKKAAILVGAADPANPANSLTIYGQAEGSGTLEANADPNYASTGGHGAAIGGNGSVSISSLSADRHCGRITINGGTVYANSARGAAIGGGRKGDGGHIIINGGSVTACSNGSTGIGSGDDTDGNGGEVIINGGSVTALSDMGGAGIGGGQFCDGEYTITINGGIVNARAIKSGGITAGCGIGTGSGSSSDTSVHITINGGFVKAGTDTGEAGIGGNNSTLTIGDPTLTVTSGMQENPMKVMLDANGNGLGDELAQQKYITIGHFTPYRIYDSASNGLAGAYAEKCVSIGSDTTAWEENEASGGFYSVEGNVTISDDVAVTGHVKLILKDGSSLTVSGSTAIADGGSLSICGQYLGSGIWNADGGISGGGTVSVYGGTVFAQGETGAVSCGGLTAYTDFAVYAGTDAEHTEEYAHASNTNITELAGKKYVLIKKYCTYEAYDLVSGAFYTVPLTAYDTVASSNAIRTWSDGWYVVKGGTEQEPIVLGDGVIVSGDVKLLLTDGSYLKVQSQNPGISIGEDSRLTVYGQSGNTGVLTVESSGQCAGISGSNITLNGGTVNAVGGQYAAGIGGNKWGSGSYITVNGGTVTARGGEGGAGIGGGKWGSGSYITVNGGVVDARGNTGGAGIGSGFQKNAEHLSLNGGTITAVGGSGAAGVGNGGDCQKEAADIFVNLETEKLLAGASENPTTEVKDTDHNGFANELADKQYVRTVSLLPYRENTDNAVRMISLMPDDYTVITAADHSWGSGCYAVTGNVTISGGVAVTGDVKLILKDGCTLTVTDELQIAGGSRLSVYGQRIGSGCLNVCGGIGGSGSMAVHGGSMIAQDDSSAIACDLTVHPELTILTGADAAQEEELSRTGSTDIVDLTDRNYVRIVKAFHYQELQPDGSFADARLENCVPIATVSDIVTLYTGWYVVEGGTEEAPIQLEGMLVNGDAKLLLTDDSYLKVEADTYCAGVGVYEGSSLTICGQSCSSGVLTAKGGLYGAGIGGASEIGSNGLVQNDGGNITVNGGTVNACGGGGGAGIGGGMMGSFEGITINGGVVFAIGSDGSITVNEGNINEILGGGAGIGGGGAFARELQGYGAAYDAKAVSSITLNGGRVIAVGGKSTEQGILTAGDGCGVGPGGRVQATAAAIGLGGSVGPVSAKAGLKIFAGSSTASYAEASPLNAADFYKRFVEFHPTEAVSYRTYTNPGFADAVLAQGAYHMVNPADTEWKADAPGSGWYLVEGSVTLDHAVTVSGDVKLVLTNGSRLKIRGEAGKAGLTVAGGKSLVVYGQSGDTGRLTVTGGSGAAGIDNQNSLTLNGGVISAVGGSGGCGINGGSAFRVNGGTVLAEGGSGASAGSGIGGTVTIDSLLEIEVKNDAAAAYQTEAYAGKRFVRIASANVCYLGTDTTDRYLSLADALNALTDGVPGTLTLIRNVKETLTIASDSNITIDIHGQTLSAESGCPITNEGTLTLTDTAAAAGSVIGAAGSPGVLQKGTLILAGKASVTDVRLAAGKTVTIDPGYVGRTTVSSEVLPVAGAAVTVTGTGSDDFSDRLISSSPAYKIYNSGAGAAQQLVLSVHEHFWKYETDSKDPAVLKASCIEPFGTADCDTSGFNLSVTLTKPPHSVYGDNKSADAVPIGSDGKKAFSLGTITSLPSVSYSGRDGTSYASSAAAPAAPGSYTAELTIDDSRKAVVNYTISKASQTSMTGPISVASRTDTAILLTELTVVGETTEYAISQSGAAPADGWQTGCEFRNLTADSSYYIYARLRESSNYAAGSPTSLQVKTKAGAPQAPAAPTIVTNGSMRPGSTQLTVETVAGYEYLPVKDGEASDWAAAWTAAENGTKTFSGLTPATKYSIYTRAAETDTAMPGSSSFTARYTLPVQPAATAVTVDYAEERISYDSCYEVNTAEDFSGEQIASGSNILPATAYYVRVRADGSVPASDSTVITTAARPAVTDLTAAFETIQGKKDAKLFGMTDKMEYKIGSGDWTVGSGTDLANPENETICVRVRATADSFAGEIQTVGFIASTVTIPVTFGELTAACSYYSLLTQPADPQKEGYTFGGWYTDREGTDAWNFEYDRITTETNLYPRWIKNDIITAGITGKVTDGANPVSGAVVELRKGRVKVAATVTDILGNYSFGNAEIGVYNLVVMTEGRIKSLLAEVNGSGCCTIPAVIADAKNVSSRIVCEGSSTAETRCDTAQLIAGGVDAVAAGENPAGTDRITVTLTVKPEPEDAAGSGQTEIREKADGRTLEFLNMTLTKQLNEETPVSIGATNTQLLTVRLPFDTAGVDAGSVTVYRYHNGTAEAFERIGSETDRADGTFMLQDGFITVYTKKFSTYAVGYRRNTSSFESRYAVTISAAEHGSVTSDLTKAAAGSIVHLTVTPDSGWRLQSIRVLNGAGRELSLTALTAGERYCFAMPLSRVSVIADFERVPGFCRKDDTCVLAAFADINLGAWYHDAIHFCAENGYMDGISKRYFAPNTALSRAMFVTLLWRLDGKPTADCTMSFKDVPAGQWYTEAIRWAQSTEIVQGYTEERFGPTDVLTREQLAAILFRYAAYKGMDVTAAAELSAYTDAGQIHTWAAEAMQWAVAVCLLQGRSADALAPAGTATRAEAATLIYRLCSMSEI